MREVIRETDVVPTVSLIPNTLQPRLPANSEEFPTRLRR